MDKSYVTLAQRTCVMCGKTYDTNELLLDKRLKPVFDRYTNVGFGVCDECKVEGHVICIETEQVGDEFKTLGRYALVTNDAWNKIFTTPVPEVGVAFVSTEIQNQLERIWKNSPPDHA